MSNNLQQFLEWEKRIPDALFLRQPLNGKWKHYTYSQAGDEIRRIATGLKTLPPGSHIALLSKNCMHWIMADLAIMMCGHVSVPIYATLSAASVRQVLLHADASAIIIGKLDNYDDQKDGIPNGLLKIGIDAYGIRGDIQWDHWLRNAPLEDYHQWSRDEVFTIVYTSGTTGQFKGVMHTIGSFDVLAKSGINVLGFREQSSLFSFLPLSHTAERIGIETTGIYLGAQFSFPESVDTFNANLMDTQPHHFFAVPRLWTKIREGILEKISQRKLDLLISLPVVGSIVRNKIKKKLGLSRARVIVSGAAPISVEMLNWFSRIGIEILQGYGLTENCCSHIGRPGRNRIGTIGLPLPCFEAKIAEGGEIRVKGPGNMLGYYKEPELTALAFDNDHYLRTGDIGEIDDEGFLTITGRIKDQFKTDKGKYISPTPIEMLFTKNANVEQVCVVGMGIPQPIALVVLSVAGRSRTKEQLIESLTSLLTEINSSGIESYEKLMKVVIMNADWSIENGMLTPTLKLKRNEIERLKLSRYSEWYKMPGVVIWE